MLNVGKTHDTVRVVNDQVGTSTYTYNLARLFVDMNVTEKYGYYHATNEGGYISWYDFTKEIYRQAGYKTEVLPVTTAEYGLSKAVVRLIAAWIRASWCAVRGTVFDVAIEMRSDS